MLMQKFWGVNKMYYGNGENSEWYEMAQVTQALHTNFNNNPSSSHQFQ